MGSKNKIKVLYTIPNFKTAGSQYVLLSLFRNIDRTIFEPFICIEKFPESIPPDISEDKYFIFEWTENKLKDILRFRKILKNNNIQIVHSWNYKSNYIEALAVIVSGVNYLYTKKNNSWSKRWFLKSVFSSHIAYNNPEMKKRFFNSVLLRNKISFIPHGINTSVFKPLKKNNRKTFNIGCIGNIGANKNQLFIIEALRELPEVIQLHLYGKEKAEYRKILNGTIKKNDLESRVHFHGYIANKNIPDVFRNLDLLVLASFQEGLPVSILEALACGIQVLSSDSGGGSKYLLGSESIFPIENNGILIQKILKIYNLEASEKEILAAKGIKNVIENHSLEKEIVAYENLYKKLIKT